MAFLPEAGRQLAYAAGSQPKRLQPAGGFTSAASSGTLPGERADNADDSRAG